MFSRKIVRICTLISSVLSSSCPSCLAIFWLYGKTKEQGIKGDQRIVLHWKWALLYLNTDQALWSASSTLSVFVSETSSYRTSRGLVPLLLRMVCALAHPFLPHLMPETKESESWPLPVLIYFWSLAGACKGNSMETHRETLVSPWTLLPQLHSRPNLLMEFSYSCMIHVCKYCMLYSVEASLRGGINICGGDPPDIAVHSTSTANTSC